VLGAVFDEGGAGNCVLGRAELSVVSGFFLPQLNQLLVLGALNPLLVWQPVNVRAEMLYTAARKTVVRQRLLRMANASFR
jgi:hypothetical protein